MAEDCLTAHVPERRGYGSYEGETTPAPGNLVNRDFTVGMPNGKWLTDITEIKARDGKVHLSPMIGCHDGRIIAYTAGSGPNAGLATGCSSRPWNHCRRERILWCIPTADATAGARMAGAHGPLRPDTVDGRQRLFSGQRRRGGVLRTHEDGIRSSRALGGAYPQRGARPGRRIHPLARPRAHQTVSRLDTPDAIPSEPGNGCVIISKKTSTAPYQKIRSISTNHQT